jgi:hypothetical protein
MKTVDDMRRVLKKLFHNYSLVVIVALIFATIIVVLLGSRYFALASIRDLSQINPLITSTENRLVTTDATGKIVKAPADSLDGDTDSAGSSQSSDTSKKSSSGGSGGSSSGSSGGTTTGGGTTQGANNTPNTNTGTTNQGNTTTSDSPGSSGASSAPPPFTFGFGSITYNSEKLSGSSRICTIRHKITFNITGQNGSGNNVSYQFKETNGLSDDTKPGGTVTFNSGDTSKPAPHTWTIQGVDDYIYSVTLQITSPSSASKTYSFKHDC